MNYDLPRAIGDEVTFRVDFYKVCNEVLSREWFSRVWVIQEVIVSADIIILIGGYHGTTSGGLR